MCTSVRSKNLKRKGLASAFQAAAKTPKLLDIVAKHMAPPGDSAQASAKEPSQASSAKEASQASSASKPSLGKAAAAGSDGDSAEPPQTDKTSDRQTEEPSPVQRAEMQLARLGYEVCKEAPMSIWDRLGKLRETHQTVSLNCCRRCKQELKDLRVQSKGKSSPCMVCDPCNRGSVMLARHCAWPSAEFQKLDLAAQTEFWEDCGKLQVGPEGEDIGLTWDRLRECLKRALAKSQMKIQETKTSEGGSFQPLSYYERKGYDIAAIEANSHDVNKQWHDVLKVMTYRLAITRVEYSDILQRVENHISELEANKKDKKMAARSQRLEDKAAEEAEAEPPMLDEKQLEKQHRALLAERQKQEKEQAKLKQRQEKDKGGAT